MSGYGNGGYGNNGGGYGNGGGQQNWGNQQQGQQQRKPPKLPQPGEGRLRKVQKSSEKSPDFRGFANYNGQMVSISIWYQAPLNKNGQMLPEGWSMKLQAYQGEILPPDPPRQQNGGQQGWGGQQSQQQGFQYGAPPQQQYAPQQQATGYTAHPQAQGYGQAPQQPPYQPTPSAAPQQPPQGGYGGQNYGQAGASFGRDEIPF